MSQPNYPPGPKGSGAKEENLRRFQEDYAGFVRELVDAYGDIVCFQLGERSVCLLNHPDFIKKVFLTAHQNFNKPEALKASNRGYWGDGLTTLEGERWRRMRRLMQPAFHHQHIGCFAEMMVACTQEMMAGWRPGDQLDIHQEMLTLVTRIAARVIFDAELEAYVTPATHTKRAGIIPMKEANGVQYPVTLIKGQTDSIQITRPRAGRKMKQTLKLIEERFAGLEERQDMLSFLLQAGAKLGCPLSLEEVVGETIQMLFAGHLNTPRVLYWLWYALAKNPEVERKLYTELESVLGGRTPDVEDLPQLPYLEMVIKETMRAYLPSGVSFQREVIDPVEVGGYTLAPGTMIWVDVHLLHHDPRNFPDPGRFWPERFSQENGHPISKYAYLPFGVGPRTCIGNHFAMMQMRLIAAAIAQTYQLTFLPDQPDGRPKYMQLIARMNDTQREKIKRNRQFLKPDWPQIIATESDQDRNVSPPPLQKPYPEGSDLVDLVPPEAFTVGQTSLVDLISRRQSRRQFTTGPLTLEELSFLLWSVQGIKSEQHIDQKGWQFFPHREAFRTVPAAGALHSFETYLHIERVTGLEQGLYRYLPLEHKLLIISNAADIAAEIAEAWENDFDHGAVLFIWTANPYRKEWRYTLAAHRLIAIDAGHMGQNLYLACEAIDCGTYLVGGVVNQQRWDQIVAVDGEEEFVFSLAPVGRI